jgi:hypothetical protein
METVIMFSLLLIFGITSLLLKKHDNRSFKIIFLIVTALAIAVLIGEAILNSESRYVSILFIMIGISFFVKQFKSIVTPNKIPKW